MTRAFLPAIHFMFLIIESVRYAYAVLCLAFFFIDNTGRKCYMWSVVLLDSGKLCEPSAEGFNQEGGLKSQMNLHKGKILRWTHASMIS